MVPDRFLSEGRLGNYGTIWQDFTSVRSSPHAACEELRAKPFSPGQNRSHPLHPLHHHQPAAAPPLNQPCCSRDAFSHRAHVQDSARAGCGRCQLRSHQRQVRSRRRRCGRGNRHRGRGTPDHGPPGRGEKGPQPREAKGESNGKIPTEKERERSGKVTPGISSLPKVLAFQARKPLPNLSIYFVVFQHMIYKAIIFNN